LDRGDVRLLLLESKAAAFLCAMKLSVMFNRVAPEVEEEEEEEEVEEKLSESTLIMAFSSVPSHTCTCINIHVPPSFS